MRDMAENSTEAMQGSPGLGSGKESNGKMSSEVALGSIHPTSSTPQAVPSSAGLLLPPEKEMPGGTKCLFSSAGWREGGTSCERNNSQVPPETRTAPWCLEQANRNSTKKQKPPNEMSCSGFLPVSKTSHTIRPARRATHRNLKRKPQTVSKMMSP